MHVSYGKQTSQNKYIVYNKIYFYFVDIKHSKVEIFHQEELVTTKRYV